jgi:hypothetical protein
MDCWITNDMFEGSRIHLGKEILRLLKFFSLAVTPGSMDIRRSFKPRLIFQLNANREHSVVRKF